jgi:hypothetical protein
LYEYSHQHTDTRCYPDARTDHGCDVAAHRHTHPDRCADGAHAPRECNTIFYKDAHGNADAYCHRRTHSNRRMDAAAYADSHGDTYADCQ